jgi:hypothetical protein
MATAQPSAKAHGVYLHHLSSFQGTLYLYQIEKADNVSFAVKKELCLFLSQRETTAGRSSGSKLAGEMSVSYIHRQCCSLASFPRKRESRAQAPRGLDARLRGHDVLLVPNLRNGHRVRCGSSVATGIALIGKRSEGEGRQKGRQSGTRRIRHGSGCPVKPASVSAGAGSGTKMRC